MLINGFQLPQTVASCPQSNTGTHHTHTQHGQAQLSTFCGSILGQPLCSQATICWSSWTCLAVSTSHRCVPQGALPRSAAERANRFPGVAEDSPCPEHGLEPPKNRACRQCLAATKGSELYYLSAYATTSASYAHGGDDAEYKKEFRM